MKKRSTIEALALYVKGYWRKPLNLLEATELYLDRQEGMISKNTIKIYRHGFTHLIRFFGPKIAVNKIDKLKAELFRTDLIKYRRYSKSNLKYRIDGKRLSVSTIRQIIKIARILFAWLLEVGKVESNPFDNLKLPALPSDEPEIVEAFDFEKFVYQVGLGVEGRANNQVLIVRDTAILYFLRSTGCRVSGEIGRASCRERG